MSPIQQMLLGVGAVATKTYVDDVFSTYLYTGTGSSRSITTGIDMTEGGLVWHKPRGAGDPHWLFDTVRGTTKVLSSNSSAAESTEIDTITAFNNNGYTLGASAELNPNNTVKQASWSFRKAPGFFDVVTYTGDDNTSQQISHSLGCVPGMVIVKCTSETMSWAVYHRTTGNTKGLYLNGVGAGDTSSGFWNNTSPTSTHFTVSDADPGAFTTNKNNATYVAYVFAGGESTNALARSVDMDGTGDYINTTSSSSDFTMGTGDFTVECWVKWDGGAKGIFQISPTSGGIQGQPGFTDTMCLWIDNDSKFNYQAGGTKVAPIKIQKGQWTHVAYVRNSGTTSLYVNGTLAKSDAHTTDLDGTYIGIGGYWDTGYLWDGKISNFRVVKGTAVYTSSFKPPTEPLTNISGTVLLCCNDSSVSGSTVTPVTLNSQGDPTASTDSPFDDPAGFKFGDAGDQNVIKCGSYVGNGNDGSADGNVNGPKITLGFEPAWLLIKRTSATEDWQIYDCMRGIPSNTGTKKLAPNNSDSESGDLNYLRLSADGFQLATANQQINADGDTYIYMAIRRPDGYVGKPPELGTGVFAMDTGNSSTTVPTYDSGFPVDMALRRATGSTANWFLSARLIQARDLKPNLNNAEGGNAAYFFDSNVGWNYNGDDTDYQSWMFKRHAGFDCLAFEGNGVNRRALMHGLNATPQMMWVKRRDSTGDWMVYHFGANGGSNPKNEELVLNTDAAEQTSYLWGEGPTSTYFELSDNAAVNGDGNDYLALLFSSVTGISKLGYYTGTESQITITTGFQPRFVLIKRTDSSTNGDWYIYDTLRGLSGSFGTGNTNRLSLDSNAAQGECGSCLANFATGFYVGTSARHNTNNGKYIYYCHA